MTAQGDRSGDPRPALTDPNRHHDSVHPSFTIAPRLSQRRIARKSPCLPKAQEIVRVRHSQFIVYAPRSVGHVSRRLVPGFLHVFASLPRP